MKICAFFAGVLLCISTFSCSSSSETSDDNSLSTNPVSYNLIVSGGSGLYVQTVLSDIEGLSVGTTATSFSGFSTPAVKYSTASKISLYLRTNDCGGKFLIYDFKTDTEITETLFSDLAPCNISVIAIAHQGNQLFLSYSLTTAGKKYAYFIRSVDLNTNSFLDAPLDKKPLDMELSKDRLFILSTDESGTNDNWITVIDVKEKNFVHEMNVGQKATKIFKNPLGAIVISYPGSHTSLNSLTLESTYTKYAADKEPNFFGSRTLLFDGTGKMYYTMKTTEGDYTPAVYDFNDNMTTVYYFENFLTESQLQVQFDIKEATVVGYDDVNKLILIGYKKDGNNGGGIIRITPAPDLTFLDHLDLEDVPYSFFTK